MALKWQDYAVTVERHDAPPLNLIVRAISEGDAQYACTVPCKRNNYSPRLQPGDLLTIKKA